MIYPIAIHKDKSSDYGVIVPDLPGCFSAGETLDEAIAMAREAVELHLEGLVEEGQAVPPPTSIEQRRRNPEYRDAIWATVSVDLSDLRLRSRRVNITIPERVLDAVDRFAHQHGDTRSGLLVRAVTSFMKRKPSQSPPVVNRPGRRPRGERPTRSAKR